jgi:S1-C subfamily serine protease
LTLSIRQPANGAEVVRSSQYPDLALLRLVVANRARWNRHPLVLAQACSYAEGDAVYMIGFPDVASRAYKYARPIEDKSILKRRWSWGRILGPYHHKEPGAEMKFWIGITADGLGGNSGGPGLNAQGEVVGELDSAGKENRGGAYLGNDSLGIPHAMLQRCEYLDDFINLGPLAYRPLE